VFYFRNDKMLLKKENCTGCAACIGGCPGEALAIESFDENRFILQFAASDETLLSCNYNTPCLAVFDQHHFIAAAMQKGRDFGCDLSHCATCGFANAGAIREIIEERVAEANRFLAELGLEARIGTEPANLPSGRRGFFKKLSQIAINQTLIEKQKISGVNPTATPVPIKKTLVKNRLKEWLETSDKEQVDNGFSFIANKRVDAARCSNCGECSAYCPTKAFSMDTTKERLFFQLGKCISCGICKQVCPEKCVEDAQGFNLINYAFDRAEKLVEHPLKICRTCKLSFPAKHEDESCPHCHRLQTELADMFRPASEME
jgi:Pyruvate/2-oxoacid:ferredoxin oxidoreductase delta subunit